MILEAKYADDGRPEFTSSELKEMEARSRGPIDQLTDVEMGIVLQNKEEGNSHFRVGNIEPACRAYNKALEVFADRTGDKTQRLEKSKLLANRAECLLRLEHWEAAAKSASLALKMDATNAKARFRRARALVALGGENRLADAASDVEQLKGPNGSLGRAERELMQKIQTQRAELRETRRRDAGGLRTAFKSGRVGLSGDDDDHVEELSAVSQLALEASPIASAWMSQLDDNVALQHSWLIDCYRTRVDDDKSAPHGLGDPKCSTASILLDFLIFCRLAVARGVVPPAGAASSPSSWDWAAFVNGGMAAAMLGKAFNPQICRAELRYGPAMGDAARIRAMGALVYEGETATRVRIETMEACWKDGGVDESGRLQHMFTFDLQPTMFAEVGGVTPWRGLLAALGASLGGKI